MFARNGVFSSIGRASAVATVVAVALTTVQPSVAFAGSPTPAKEAAKGVTASSGTSDTTDIGARRRHYGGGGAAAAAAFAGIVGTGLAIAAAQSRRDYYYDNYGYYGAPAYGYYGGPVYYGGPAYYGSGRSYRNPGGYNNPNAYGYGAW
jgi:hypothetical protein